MSWQLSCHDMYKTVTRLNHCFTDKSDTYFHIFHDEFFNYDLIKSLWNGLQPSEPHLTKDTGTHAIQTHENTFVVLNAFHPKHIAHSIYDNNSLGKCRNLNRVETDYKQKYMQKYFLKHISRTACNNLCNVIVIAIYAQIVSENISVTIPVSE